MNFSNASSFDWFVMAVLLIAGVILISGKGSFLLVSKADRKDKKKTNSYYDEKKTGRLGGSMLLIVLILEVLHIFFIEQLPIMEYLYGPGVMLTVIVFLFLIYKTCRKET